MKKNAISFREALRFWIKLGFISFGGPAGQIAVMQRELVEQKKWIAQDDFLHALNFCMFLPGPEAQQLATYVGWRLHGTKGGIAAGAFFVIPSIFFLLILSYIYAAYGSIPQISAVLNGFKAVVVAIVIEALVKIGGKSFKTYRHILIAAAAFILIYFFQISFPLIILGAAVTGFSALRESETIRPDETIENDAQTNPLKIIAVCALFWLLPFAALLLIFGYENILVKTYLFFTKSAFVTFGGAYAVLAYVNQIVVEAGWITAAQSIDGLALAETTPGPLIMVLQFIGFMTGWNNPSGYNQTWFAVLCGLATTFVTFLPSFLFIFVGAPYIERLRNDVRLKSALAGVTASVVGVILNLALVFGATVVFPQHHFDFFTAGLAVSSFIALYFLKFDVLIIIAAGGFCGLAKFWLIG